MPEIIEVEMYRRLADRLLGSRVTTVETPDAWFIKGGASPNQIAEALEGAVLKGTERIGKLLMLDLGEQRPILGLRFGMTGRLVLDDHGPIDQLEYSSGRDLARWNRFALTTDDGARLRLSDPRRLGGVELDPDTRSLGPDALVITADQMHRAVCGSTAPLKARLLDQSRVAGLGNLIVDETLWRIGLDPAMPAGHLDAATTDRLANAVRETVRELTERGGSHTGDLHDQRHRGGRCPLDGEELSRRTIGGRTTYSCPLHQSMSLG